MDKAEARRVARNRIGAVRELPYAELRARYLGRPERVEVTAASGKTYQLKINAVWDSKSDQRLRVFVEVDDGGWRAFFPLSESFIVAPDGSFVGE